MTQPRFKLANVTSTSGRTSAAMVLDGDDGFLDIASAGKKMLPGELLESARNLDDLLADWDRSFGALAELASRVVAEGGAMAAGSGLVLKGVRVRQPVVRPGKMVCHAQNYADHVLEMRRSRFGADKAPVDMSTDFMGEKAKTWPYAFLKASSSLIGPNDDIVLARGHNQIDWEAELAVVIGRQGKRMTEENAMSLVAGFMTFNDVSCRDNQWRTDRPTLRSDWFSAKSFDTFAPSGPFLVPAAFAGDPLNLLIRLSVNGKTVQDGNTGGLIFSPAEQIAYFSRCMTWYPGDILATGTPAGTGQGAGFFLKPGDVVECEIEGLGKQRNVCVADID